jgi:pimeloyl-ACP methyl ester carboxylesterase
MIHRFLILFSLLLVCKYSNCQATDSIVVSNAVLYYYTYGTGEPIIILSGGPGHASHMEDDVAIELGGKYKAILFDQRGTGNSWTKPFDSSTINIDQAIEDLDILRKHLHITKLNLYGHSWGSMLAAAYIAKYPERVRLFISNGGGPLDTTLGSTVNDNIQARFQLGDTVKLNYWMDSAIWKQDSLKAQYELTKLEHASVMYDTTKLDNVMKQLTLGGGNGTMAELMLKSFFSNDLHFVDRDRKYKGAVLIVFGWNDPIGLTTVTQYLQAFPAAKIKGIYKSGHFPEIEQPREFYETINPFLQNNIMAK